MTAASEGGTAGAVLAPTAPVDHPVRPVDEPPGPHRVLRDVLGRYPTGVAVVTTADPDGRPAGVTVNSFTAVSLDPPLVLWCLALSSSSLAAFTAAEYFAVQVLAASQRDLATRFAASRADRFHGLPVAVGPHGLPLLPDVAATLVCRRTRLLPAGDHMVLWGAVQSCTSGSGPALLFADSAFHPGPAPAATRPAPGSRWGVSDCG